MASIYNGGGGFTNIRAYKNDKIWRQWVGYQTNATTSVVWANWNDDWYGLSGTNSITMTNSANIYLNDTYIGTGDNLQVEFVNDWAMNEPMRLKMSWNNWNEHYEETQEQKIARRVHEFANWARLGARYPGQAQVGHGPVEDLDELLAEVAREIEAELTPEQWRAIEDGWQRGMEEHREDLHRAEIQRMAAEERERVEGEANRRAELLLLSLLTHEQKEEWLAHRYVTEVAPSGKVWRLYPKWAGAACLMAGNVRRATLCLHPLTRVPDVDVMAAILVGLRSGQEEHYIKIAILHGGEWTKDELDIRRGFQTRQIAQPDGYVVVAAEQVA